MLSHLKSSAPCRTNAEAEEGDSLTSPQLHVWFRTWSPQWKCDALSWLQTECEMESKRFPPPLFPSITLHLKISCPPSPDHSQKGLLAPLDPQRPPHQPVPQVSIRVESDSEESGVYSREHRYNPFAPADPPAPLDTHRARLRAPHARFSDSCAETILWSETLEEEGADWTQLGTTAPSSDVSMSFILKCKLCGCAFILKKMSSRLNKYKLRNVII